MMLLRCLYLRAVAAILLGVTVGAQENPTKPAAATDTRQRKVGPMIHVIAKSPSAVLRSTHILLIRLEASHADDWSNSKDSGVERHVDLRLKLEETLKGITRERPGDQIHVRVTQFATGTSRIAAVPGVWSYQSLEPGTRYVAFCQATSNTVTDMVQDPLCEKLLPAANALLDVRLALKIESEDLSAKDLFALARPSAASLNYIFTEYIWARLGDSVLAQPDTLEKAMQFLETPELSHVARATLLNSVFSRVMVSRESADCVRRLAITMFRLIGLKEAAQLHDNLVKPLLPNLLGLTGGAAKRTAAEVFQKYPEERRKAEQALRAYSGESPTEPLLDWLR